MGEAKRQQLVVRQQAVEVLGYKARAGHSKCAGMTMHRPPCLGRWLFSSSF